MVSVKERRLSKTLTSCKNFIIIEDMILYHFWEFEYCTISLVLRFYDVKLISVNTQMEQQGSDLDI